MATMNPYTGQETFTEWQTPPNLFTRLDAAVGGFQVDAAANEANHLVSRWYGPSSILGEDALSIKKWLSPAFCNPPYGKGIVQWMEKFIEQAALGVTTVAIIPARVESRWWYNGVVLPRCDVVFLTGRVSFIKPGQDKSQPDHPSAVVTYSPLPKGRVSWLDWRKK